MNPVFIFLVIVSAFLLWAALNVFFPNIGDVIYDMWEDIKRNSKNKEER